MQIPNVDPMVILENKIVPTRERGFCVSQTRWYLPVLPDPTPPGKEAPKPCQLEHFEDITPMGNQPRNINQWESDAVDELDKLVRLLPQDGPHGELGTKNGDSGLTHAFWDVWKFVMESEGKCHGDYFEHDIGRSEVHVDVTLTCRYPHDK